MTESEFIENCNKIGINVDKTICSKLMLYCGLLQEWNKKFNLTSIIDTEDIYLKHFYDSLLIIGKVNIKGLICDFGTGAGFPGLVLAIVCKDSKFDLIESNGKKVIFLNEVKDKLNLDNVNIINSRVEDYSKNNIEKYDVVVCRAVSNLGIISELSLPILKTGGIFAPYKTNGKEEYDIFKNELIDIGFSLKEIFDFKLPKENSNRSIIVLEKSNYNISKCCKSYKDLLKKYK